MKDGQNVQISLQSFEGPLDLLLHLIESDKMNIHEVPIARITDQYTAYLKQSIEFELDIASDFLVMAATLIALKARSLLPKSHEKDVFFEASGETESNPEQDLKERLIEYRAFKMLAQTLEQKQLERAQCVGRLPTPLEPYRDLPTVSDFLAGLELHHLQDALVHALSRTKPILDVNIIRDRETIPERMGTILKTLRHEKRTFISLIKNYHRKEIVTVFLAILELIRLNKITCKQEVRFGDIWVELKKTHS